MNAFEERQAVLATEFERYVMEHHEFAAKIPQGAQMVIEIEGAERFNAWARTLAKKQHEQGQPVVWVKAKGLMPAHSRLDFPVIEKVS